MIPCSSQCVQVTFQQALLHILNNKDFGKKLMNISRSSSCQHV
jgi:hypothetical protein